jgi:hypothetical protein
MLAWNQQTTPTDWQQVIIVPKWKSKGSKKKTALNIEKYPH